MTSAPASTSSPRVAAATSSRSAAGRSAKSGNASIRLVSTVTDRATGGTPAHEGPGWRSAGAPERDLAAERAEVADAGLVHRHRDAEARDAERQRCTELRAGVEVERDALDRHPLAELREALQLHLLARHRAAGVDARDEAVPAAERDRRLDCG